MKSYSWLALRGQLWTGVLIAGVVVGVGVPEGSGQSMYATMPVRGRGLNSITPNQGGSANADWFADFQKLPEDARNELETNPEQMAAYRANPGIHAKLQKREKEDEKKEEQAERTDEKLGGNPIYKLKDGTEFVQANDHRDLIRVKPPGKG